MLNVVNRHPDQAIEAEIEAQDKKFSGAVEVWEVNGPDIKAENDFGSTKVRAVERSATAQGNRPDLPLSTAFVYHVEGEAGVNSP